MNNVENLLVRSPSLYGNERGDSVSSDRAASQEPEAAIEVRCFEFIKHGDQAHQDWLRAACEAFFNGGPRPMPQDIPSKDREIVAAAEKLVRCKGRYHSELNMIALAALFGVTLPPAGSQP